MERDAPDGRRVRRAWTVLLAVCLAWTAAAQRRVGLAYYDLGALYDTVPSLFYDDGDYTPAGSRHWTAERYGATLSRLASVLDSLAMPLVGLYGVETERAALDLAARSGGDYCVVHRTLNSMDGLDFALLYQADRLEPRRVETGYGWMSVEGMLDDSAVVLLLCRHARFLADRVGELRTERPDARLIVMGGVGGYRGERDGLQDPLRRAERAGRGNRHRRGGWLMEDRILVDGSMWVVRADVYARGRLRVTIGSATRADMRPNCRCSSIYFLRYLEVPFILIIFVPLLSGGAV